MIGERINAARKAAGISTKELGARIGLSAMTISNYERGRSTPSSDVLLRLSKALGRRVEFFFRGELPTIERLSYRKRSTLGKKETDRIIQGILEKAERLIEAIKINSPKESRFECPLSFRLNSLDETENIANDLRDAWELGSAPIGGLVQTVESKGILVLTSDYATSQFDGFAALINGFPVIAIGSDWPGDRQRFTIAHELGHLIFHGRICPDIDEERACNRFAGAFLIPKDEFKKRIQSPDQVNETALSLIKQEFGISQQALIFRASDLGIISLEKAKSLQAALKQKGFHIKEPGPEIPFEKSDLLIKKSLDSLKNGIISPGKCAELLGIDIFDLKDFIRRPLGNHNH